MANLYLTEQNSILRKSGQRLIVQKGSETLLEVQDNKIEAVLIFGNVQVTTQVLHELLRQGIELAILTRSGKLIGQITAPATKNIALRLEQFKKYWDSGFRLALAKAIVAAKIKNCLALIRLFSYNHQDQDQDKDKESGSESESISVSVSESGGRDLRPCGRQGVEALRLAASDLEARLQGVDRAADLEQLMGVEGSAASAYFGAFGRMILADGFSFSGRRKHPAQDPVNALLSLSYTMIFTEIASLLDGSGFDPYLAYYHSLDYGRASLAADLMEEFRAPLADRLVLSLINNRILKPADFYSNPKDGGVYLKREPLKRYFVEYEKMLTHEFTHPQTEEKTTFRKCFRLQIERLASTIQNNIAYFPFLLRV
ncbi:MAG: CRISPR-associated endonuclease Cas1 [bacterium]|nr:CRISPR-associated endonuclease Cas1 [bacterium]